MKKYDYLIVGAGLFGATAAQQLKSNGKSCLIIDRCQHIAGNCYDEVIEGINIHRYGPHIFHTNNRYIWDYVNTFDEFLPYKHQVMASVDNMLVSMPINLYTLNKLYDIDTPKKAIEYFKIVRQDVVGDDIESWCLRNIGSDLYENLIKEYTIKQWGQHPKDLPDSIIKRLPIRLTYDNNYFFDSYQGIPKNGYTNLISNIIKDIDIELNTSYNADDMRGLATKVIYSGSLDELYGTEELPYRQVTFADVTYPHNDVQGVAQINYPSLDVKYTRTTEHKHFNWVNTNKTIISYEFPTQSNGVKAYPINTKENNELYNKYKKLADRDGYIVGGRLGSYQYMDMHQVIAQAMNLVEKELKDEL